MRLDIDEIPIALLMVKKDLKIYFANRRLCDLFGYHINELIGQDTSILVLPKYRSIHEEKATEYLKHPVYMRLGTARDLHGLKKDGAVVPLEIGLYPFREYVIALLIDITTGRRYAVSENT